ncbi:MAG: hypothetical protein V2I76_01340 [Roseobacter sp.]|jgi:hypothetical protein|nr:hypothetical protein [Roseobacter sp.]
MGHSFGMVGHAFMTSPALRVARFSAVIALLAACGSAPPSPRGLSAPVGAVDLASVPRFAEGPVGTACTVHNRRVATAQKCGCIQAAANLTLSQQEQMRAVRFFAEPELLQEVKLSDTPANERFWETWARFADTAEALCGGA